MRVAIASGKGGTGKTTVATNLAFVAAAQGRRVAYADCDVEEPNGHLFLHPVLERAHRVCVPVPSIDPETCALCGQCAAFCRFNALALAGKRVLVFPELCHGCGGCARVCPNMAIDETDRAVGLIEIGSAGDIVFVQGRLDVGEAAAPPVIRAVKEALPQSGLVLLDAPPGTACPVIETVRGCDFVLLVTEPTPFGLHDLKLAVAALDQLEIPYGLVVNRADTADNETVLWCRSNGIPVLAKLPDDRRVAEAYSRGHLAALAIPGYAERMEEILAALAGAADPVPGAGGLVRGRATI